MRTITVKGNTFKRPFGIIYIGLEDIDGVKSDTLQLCETLENAQFLYLRRGSGMEAEIVSINLDEEK